LYFLRSELHIDMTVLIIRLLIWGFLGYLGGWLAAQKGYPPRLGIVLAIIFGPIGLIIGALLPATASGREEEEIERQINREVADIDRTKQCPSCRRDVAYRCRVCPRCEHRFLSENGE
jgi:uncharacterized membrane protein YeaQ/YmgE (transglycosylase-associated protein family)